MHMSFVIIAEHMFTEPFTNEHTLKYTLQGGPTMLTQTLESYEIII